MLPIRDNRKIIKVIAILSYHATTLTQYRVAGSRPGS